MDWITKSVKVEKTWVLVKGNSFVWLELCYVRIHSLFSNKGYWSEFCLSFLQLHLDLCYKMSKGNIFLFKTNLQY